jgi:transcriptional regulator, padR family
LIKEEKNVYYFPTSSALIEFLILALVEKEDSYGYEISQTIKLLANIKESTLYPILKKLEKNSYLTTYSQEFQGRKRKYYSLTGSGLDQLNKLREEWNQYISTINNIIEGNIHHDKN